VRLLWHGEADYPPLLAAVPDAPALLWVRGQLGSMAAAAVGVVGSRRATGYGLDTAGRFAAGLAQQGMTVVSGGALGIDAAAHEGALRVGGRTVAVMGCGLGKVYPAEHAGLFARIVDGGGALVSEWPLATPPAAEHFPQRNRTISGLSLGIVVVEAARRSGSLITARLAVEEHGRECMVVPGRVDIDAGLGGLEAIRDGWAQCVLSVADVLRCVGEQAPSYRMAVAPQQAHLPAGPAPTSGLTATQARIVAAADGRTLDELVDLTGLGAQDLLVELTMLELRGAVRGVAGLFTRVS
jgi:DNA processing protein